MQFRRTLLQLNGGQYVILPELTNVTWFYEGYRPVFQIELEHDQLREVLKFLQSDAIRSPSGFRTVSSSIVLQVLGSKSPPPVAPVTTVISIHIYGRRIIDCRKLLVRETKLHQSCQ